MLRLIAWGMEYANLISVVEYVRQVTLTLSERWKAEVHTRRKWCRTTSTMASTSSCFQRFRIIACLVGLMCQTVLHQNYNMLSHSLLLLKRDKFRKKGRRREEKLTFSAVILRRNLISLMSTKCFGRSMQLCSLATKHIFLYNFKWLYLRGKSFHFLFAFPPESLTFYLSP